MGTYRASPTCATGLPYSTQQSHLSSQERCLHAARDVQHPRGRSAPRHHNWHSHKGSTTVTPWMCTSTAQASIGTNFKSAQLPSLSISPPDVGFFSFSCATPWVLLPHHSWPRLCLCPHAGSILVMCQARHSITQLATLTSSSSPAPLASPQDQKDKPRQRLRTQISLREIQAAGMGAVGRATSRLSLGTAGFGACRRQGLDEGALCQPHVGSLQAPSSAALVSRGIPLSKCSPPSPCIVLWLCRGISHSPTSLRWRQAGSLASRLYLERGLISQRML